MPRSTTPPARPWTLKGVPEDVRESAIAAAKKAGLGVAQFVSIVLQEHVARGERPQAGRQPATQGLEPAPDVRLLQALSLAVLVNQETGHPIPEDTSAALFAAVADGLRPAVGVKAD